MDMVLGETTALRGASAASMGRISQEALSELQSLRKRLDATTPASSASVPMSVRAKAAA